MKQTTEMRCPASHFAVTQNQWKRLPNHSLQLASLVVFIYSPSLLQCNFLPFQFLSSSYHYIFSSLSQIFWCHHNLNHYFEDVGLCILVIIKTVMVPAVTQSSLFLFLLHRFINLFSFYLTNTQQQVRI